MSTSARSWDVIVTMPRDTHARDVIGWLPARASLLSGAHAVRVTADAPTAGNAVSRVLRTSPDLRSPARGITVRPALYYRRTRTRRTP